MTYKATAIEIMLASPSDVKNERIIARKVISQWNDEHSRDKNVVLLTMGWESHAGTDVSGTRPQALINERLVEHADLMIGVFWTRLGSPTGTEDSGTVEEIKLHCSKGKPLMLYFSDAPISMREVDRDQYARVEDFRAWAFTQGLVRTFAKQDEFHELFRHDLALMLKDNEEMRRLVTIGPADSTAAPPNPLALQLLKMVAGASGGQVALREVGIAVHYMDGVTTLLELSSTVDILKWRAALDELLALQFLRDLTGRNELFGVTPKASAVLGV